MTLVPLLILQFGVVSQIEADLQKRITAELHEKLRNMADELDTLIENQMDLAAGLAEVPILKDFSGISVANDDSYYHDRVRDLQEYFVNFQRKVRTIQAMRFVDKTGKTLVKVKEGRRIEPELLDRDKGRYYVADQSSRPFFKNALDDQIGVYVSDFELGLVQVDADFCPSMVRYSVPIRDDLTDLEGLLIINMWGTRIDETVMSAMSGFNGKAYVVEVNNQNNSRDGIYLFHEDNNQRFANQLGTNFRFTSDLGDDNWNTIRTKNKPGYMLLDDGRMYFYLNYSPYEDDRASWMLVIETAYDTVFAPIEKLRNTIWLLGGVLLLLSLLIARWVADRLATPVQELAETIKHYADGDETARYLDGGRNDEVGIVGRAFNYLCGSLERTRQERDKAERAVRQSDRLAAVGQMAAGIGHEINNPLMNIMSLARLVEDSIGEHDKSELIKSDLHTLQAEGERCARIVQGILKFARASEPSYEEFMLDALLEDTIDLLRHRADSSAVKIEMELEKGLSIQGDANQLQQVLVNILLNAIHASTEGGNINLALFSDGDYAVIEITDEGVGIAEKDMSDVFNPFFSTKPEGEGTGLGLSVSYGIIKKHDGEITLESEQGKGTRVRIRLPFRADSSMKNKLINASKEV
ncbi:MAG: sensor histidine kinase [Sulfuriflexus sp.]|nr:sensor histidine kinase [Sulfuriflexus sp.]